MAIIKAPDVPAPTAVLCWKESRLLTRCDRKAGHGGLCSWEHAEPAPSLNTKGHDDDETPLSRSDTPEISPRLQSSASTDGGVTTSAPNAEDGELPPATDAAVFHVGPLSERCEQCEGPRPKLCQSCVNAVPSTDAVENLSAVISVFEEGIENEEFARRMRGGITENDTPMPFTRCFKTEVDYMRQQINALRSSPGAATHERRKAERLARGARPRSALRAESER